MHWIYWVAPGRGGGCPEGRGGGIGQSPPTPVSPSARAGTASEEPLILLELLPLPERQQGEGAPGHPEHGLEVPVTQVLLRAQRG